MDLKHINPCKLMFIEAHLFVYINVSFLHKYLREEVCMTKTVDAVNEDQGVDEGWLGSPHIPVQNTILIICAALYTCPDHLI